MPLQPGDRVVELAALSRSAGGFSGLISIAIIVFFGLGSWTFTAAGALAGAVGGYIVGSVVGILLFPSPDGQVFIVKHGPESLASSLKAALVSSFAVSVIAALVAWCGFPNALGAGTWVAGIAAVVVGAVFACLASLA